MEYHGTSFERPAFQRMIEDIEEKKINMVITKDLSRLGRDYIKTGYYKELKGEYLGSYAPYGYKKSNVQKNKLEIDENVVQIVKKIFELYAEGNGFQKIATILDNENVTTPSKYLGMSPQRETWSSKTIRAILVNEVYCRQYCAK